MARNRSGATAPAVKGNIVVGTGTDTSAVLAVGANGTTLVADSAETTGLKWATASSGGLTLIQEQVASSNTGIDFTSISGSYKQLVLIWSGVYHSSTGGGFGIRFNSSSAGNYISSGLYVDNSTAGTEWSNNTFCGDDAFGLRASNTAPANASQGWLQIDNYASTTRVKPWLLRFSYYDNTSAAKRAYDYSGFFNDTTAITSVNIVRRSGSDTITNLSNTSIRLYGLS